MHEICFQKASISIYFHAFYPCRFLLQDHFVVQFRNMKQYRIVYVLFRIVYVLFLIAYLYFSDDPFCNQTSISLSLTVIIENPKPRLIFLIPEPPSKPQ